MTSRRDETLQILRAIWRAEEARSLTGYGSKALDPLADVTEQLFRRKSRQPSMIHSMQPYVVTFGQHASHDLRIRFRPVCKQEPCGPHTMFREHIEHCGCVR
jgi:hypothetical protein